MITWTQIRSFVQQELAGLASYVRTGDGTGSGGKDQIFFEGSSGRVPLFARRLQWFGHRSVPVDGCEGVVLRLFGGRLALALVAAESLDYGRTNMKAGESQVYCKAPGCEVFLDQDGVLRINASSAKDVIVNGGSAKVARVGDEVDCGYLAVTPGMAGPSQVVWLPPGTTPLPAPPVIVTPMIGKIKSGADRFKG